MPPHTTRIIPLPAFNDNYIWVILDEKQKTFTAVDPGTAAPVLHYATRQGYLLKNILLTHHHADHAGGINDLLQHDANIHVYGPADSRRPEVTHPVDEGAQILIGNGCFRVLSTPGHTSTHLCFYEASQGLLFCGDTLFSAGCGRVFDSNIETLYHTIMRLKQLPPSTQVYCGHEYTLQNLNFAAYVEPHNTEVQAYLKRLKQEGPSYCSLPSTIGQEHQINPFMRLDSSDILSFAKIHGIEDALGVFQLLREEKNHFNA